MFSKMETSPSSSSRPEAGSASSTAPRCRHFGSCGGCASQDIVYDEQIRRKAERVKNLLAPFGFEAAAVHPSPDVWFYRNKMEFSFSDVYPPIEGGPSLKLGLKVRGRWDRVLDLDECFLLSPETPALLASVRAWADRAGLAPHNARRHTGILRHLVVREAKNGPDRMVLVVAAAAPTAEQDLIATVRRAYPATTILWGVNRKLADTALPDEIHVLSGSGFITERLSWPGYAVSFRISPLSFFQTNARGAELLYGIVRSWLASLRPRLALDLYCGAGAIALSVADLFGKILGVETNPAAIADARENVRLNALSNVEFYGGAVETLLPSLLAMNPDAVILDPPRSGLAPKSIEALLGGAVPAIVYVSCNPETLARDLGFFSRAYEPRRMEVIDLFPHTEHVETAVFLQRR